MHGKDLEQLIEDAHGWNPDRPRLSEREARPRPPEELTLTAIAAEVMAARIKHPGRKHLLAALAKEVGELAKALLEGMPREEVEKEAIQVAAVAVRIIEEGDADFDKDPVAS